MTVAQIELGVVIKHINCLFCSVEFEYKFLNLNKCKFLPGILIYCLLTPLSSL